MEGQRTLDSWLSETNQWPNDRLTSRGTWILNIKTVHDETRHDVDWLRTETKVVDSCENGKSTLNFIKGGEFDYLRD